MELYLKDLGLKNFKNYTQQVLLFAPNINLFTGKNGMGKTNLLDAIFYLCLTKSHFGLLDSALVKKDEDFFRLDGTFYREQKAHKITVKYALRKKKIILRNEEPYEKIAEHIGFIPVVMITPDDGYLLLEGSAERRRLIDTTLSQTNKDYLQNLMNYNRLLEQRNALLKHHLETKTLIDNALLKIYDTQISPLSRAIAQQREAWILEFASFFQTYFSQVTEQTETAICEYQSELKETGWEILAEKNKEKDRVLGRTSFGIHKDDLLFTINNLPLKRYASQGQLKSFVLGLKLAQFNYIKTKNQLPPLLLLDDIFDKLDENRVAQVIAVLSSQAIGQVFITDTHQDRVANLLNEKGLSFQQFNVENGTTTLL
jgi:DNA replication and repair protein RecF